MYTIFTLFIFLGYFFFLLNLTLYITPILTLYLSNTKNKNFFFFFFLLEVFYRPIYNFIYWFILFYFFFKTFSSYLFFQHFFFTQIHLKIILYLGIWCSFCFIIFLILMFITNRYILDFLLVCLNTWFCFCFIFGLTNFFAIVFFLELLTTLVYLLLVTTTFVSYSNNTYVVNSVAFYFSESLPSFLLLSFLIFFWLSLFLSILLIFYLIYLYTYFLSFDYIIIEFFFIFEYSTSEEIPLLNVFSFNSSWVLFLIIFGLKSGILPFIFWKPLFFKGLNYYFLTFYILFYYHFFYLWFLWFLFQDISFFLIHFNLITYIFISLGILVTFFTLGDLRYLKVFLAYSSMINGFLLFMVYFFEFLIL